MPSSVETLLAIEDIKSLKARYFRAIDTKDARLLATVFAPDAVFDFREATIDPIDTDPSVQGPEPVVGGDAIVDAVSRALANVNSVHHGHMPELEVTSADTATGIWPMEDVIRRLDSDETGRAKPGFKGYGHYHETYVKLDVGWRIRTSKLTRLRIIFD
jgi:hypothetical protein